MRDGFIIHEKTMAQVAKLSNEQAGELLKAMINHYNGEENGEVSLIVDVLLVDVEERMDSDKASYEELSRKRSEAGKNGAKSRWQNDDNGKDENGKAMANDGKAIANDSKAMANDGVSDSVSVSVLKEKGILTDTQKESPAKAELLMPAAREIVGYLNEKTGSHYSASAQNTVKLIKARMKEGHTVDDFKKVIDNKVAEWKDVPEMEDFLRPNTLFAPSHFDDYLNQKGGRKVEKKPPDTPVQKKGKFYNFPQRDDKESQDLVQELIRRQLAGGA